MNYEIIGNLAGYIATENVGSSDEKQGDTVVTGKSQMPIHLPSNSKYTNQRTCTPYKYIKLLVKYTYSIDFLFSKFAYVC